MLNESVQNAESSAGQGCYGGGRSWEPQRYGVNGGRVRKGRRGGTFVDYYNRLYTMKGLKGSGVPEIDDWDKLAVDD